MQDNNVMVLGYPEVRTTSKCLSEELEKESPLFQKAFSNFAK